MIHENEIPINHVVALLAEVDPGRLEHLRARYPEARDALVPGVVAKVGSKATKADDPAKAEDAASKKRRRLAALAEAALEGLDASVAQCIQRLPEATRRASRAEWMQFAGQGVALFNGGGGFVAYFTNANPTWSWVTSLLVVIGGAFALLANKLGRPVGEKRSWGDIQADILDCLSKAQSVQQNLVVWKRLWDAGDEGLPEDKLIREANTLSDRMLRTILTVPFDGSPAVVRRAESG